MTTPEMHVFCHATCMHCREPIVLKVWDTGEREWWHEGLVRHRRCFTYVGDTQAEPPPLPGPDRPPVDELAAVSGEAEKK